VDFFNARNAVVARDHAAPGEVGVKSALAMFSKMMRMRPACAQAGRSDLYRVHEVHVRARTCWRCCSQSIRVRSIDRIELSTIAIGPGFPLRDPAWQAFAGRMVNAR
jgi:hypothetical protein